MMSTSLLLFLLLSLSAPGRSDRQPDDIVPETLLEESRPSTTTIGSDSPSSCPQVWRELGGEGIVEDEDAVASASGLLEELALALHRNGEPDPCGVAPASSVAVVKVAKAMRAMSACDGDESNKDDDAFRLNKYETEALLTDLLLASLARGECGPTDNETAPETLEGYCDMGPHRTVVQPDSKYLVRAASTGSLPCRFYTREGEHVDSLAKLVQLARAARAAASNTCSGGGSDTESCDAAPSSGPLLHLYAVPAGRMFMYAPSYVGENFVLDRMQHSAPSRQPIVLEVLSTDPRVFEVHNFYSTDEAAELIEQALSETSESHKFHRSTTGAVNGQVFSKRTSENAWLTHTSLAQTIKRRCLEFLGFDMYRESHTDGLQVLRYQNNQAYDVHPDYLPTSATENYDYDTAGVGGNRFATILLYMSGVESGGETVFPRAEQVLSEGEEPRSSAQVIESLRRSGEIEALGVGSWEETLTATCRTRLSVKPKAGRAVLFYSQYPNGAYDDGSLHGACPVLNGTKWAANLWVWNAPRHEFEYAPRKRPEEDRRFPKPADTQLHAEFRNTGEDPSLNEAELYYNEETHFGKLGPNDPPIAVNTYEGHVWHVKVKDEIKRTFVIEDKPRQVFKI